MKKPILCEVSGGEKGKYLPPVINMCADVLDSSRGPSVTPVIAVRQNRHTNMLSCRVYKHPVYKHHKIMLKLL